MNEQVKILCVDDERNVLRALQRVFMDSDYEILTAESGEEGLEILKENQGTIQLIISDYRMPGMNGVDFLKEAYRIYPDTIRIVLSGYADIASMVEAINEGHIYKFIPKPWNDEELKVTISTALDHYFTQIKNKQLTEELEKKNKELQQINEHLERLVEERTADLRMRNRILMAAQNILDSLPIGVIGVDPDGLIVQCNSKATEILGLDEGVIGLHKDEVFDENIRSLIERLNADGKLSETLSLNGHRVFIRGVHMRYDTGQEGDILVLDTEVNGNGRGD